MRTRRSLLLCGLAYCQVTCFTSSRYTSHKYKSTPSFVTKSKWTQRGTLRPICLQAKLWERLEIEEDPEPYWYLLNCVAGLEIDLLRQCRERCRDIPDAIKFVVPTEQKTRSHGANRMVTETKVKYQGYVFAKLRLCPEPYEAIQTLDLCRSWMGTVNKKGHKKLPPVPVALNELEVENFGLEDYEDVDDEKEEDNGDEVIVDTEENDVAQKATVDADALKVFLGLEVEDMVKVTTRGKFYNEDGIVRRLKEGRILVRFFTYGSMFEEWMEPGDVRKLTNEEVLRGLSGPSQPITQRDFDDPNDRDRNNWPRDRSSMRQDLMSNVKGAGGTRNRRRDRVERGDTSKRDIFGRTEQERRREERNWKWYQDRQGSKDGRGATTGNVDDEWNFRSASRSSEWPSGDVDSQWGRGPSQRQQRRERRPQGSQASKRMENAMEGKDDWSAYVSPTSAPQVSDPKEDAFFASLMSDLSDELEPTTTGIAKPTYAPTGSQSKTDDDFFASLISELSEEESSSAGSGRASDTAANDEDDFFASLEAELGTAFDAASVQGNADDATDDFFANLEAELSQGVGHDAIPYPESSTEGTEAEGHVEHSSNGKGRPVTAKPLSEDLTKYTVPVLKGMLRERGLKVSGKKNELIDRLHAS